jgi:hypothetical protein
MSAEPDNAHGGQALKAVARARLKAIIENARIETNDF